MVHMKITKGLTWPFLALALATTLIYMAGLAALQHDCAGPLNNENSAASIGYSAFSFSGLSCSRFFRFYWFIFAFVMVTLLGLAISAAIKMTLHFTRPFWVGMITISALLMMIASEAFLGLDNYFDSVNPLGSTDHHRWRTATAGAIMSVVSLILLLLAVGTDWERHGHNSRSRHDRDDKFAHTATTETYTAHQAGPAQNVRVVDQV